MSAGERAAESAARLAELEFQEELSFAKLWVSAHPDGTVEISCKLLSRLAGQAQEIAGLRRTLGFAASVIKSGEPWSETCEAIIGGAMRGVPAKPA